MSAEHPVVYRVERMEWRNDGFVVEVVWKAYKYVDGIQGEIGGTSRFTQEQDTFAPFEQLTEEVVVTWIKARVDEQDIEAKLDEDIHNKANSVRNIGLPWSRFRTQ